jgi:uncharacterized protein (DUF3084 family)
MISLLPTSTPAETTAAYTLLAVISDPKAAKQRLDDLVAEKQSLEDEMVAVRNATADYEALKAETEKDVASRKADIQVREQALAKADQQSQYTNEVRAKQLSDHEGVLARRQANLENAEADLLAREADTASREEAVKAREADVTEREAIATTTGDEAQALKAEYERKVAALQAALSPGDSA